MFRDYSFNLSPPKHYVKTLYGLNASTLPEKGHGPAAWQVDKECYNVAKKLNVRPKRRDEFNFVEKDRYHYLNIFNKLPVEYRYKIFYSVFLTSPVF